MTSSSVLLIILHFFAMLHASPADHHASAGPLTHGAPAAHGAVKQAHGAHAPAHDGHGNAHDGHPPAKSTHTDHSNTDTGVTAIANSFSLGDSVEDPKIVKRKMKANKVYQAQLKASLANFRVQQELVNKLFEKSFRKKLKEVEKENKLLLTKTLSNYASLVEEEDKRLQTQIAHNQAISQKVKNDFVVKHLLRNEPQKKKAVQQPKPTEHDAHAAGGH